MVLLLVFMQLTRDLYAIAKFLLIITLAFLGRFLYFLYHWKQEGILYKCNRPKIYHFTLTVSPHYLAKLKPRINSTF